MANTMNIKIKINLFITLGEKILEDIVKSRMVRDKKDKQTNNNKYGW